MLPQYSKQYKSEDIGLEDGANEQLLGRTSTETAPPTYPPSSSGSGAGSTVQYIYHPEYPRKGDNKTAVGVMGRTKLIVQKGFPELAEFDEERISFLNGDDAIIFDEAWEHFGSSPPEKLKIIVSDAPGEKEKRHRRNWIIGISIVTGVIFFIALMATLMIMFPDTPR